MELAGKHALVTGGGTGIGLAIAKALAAQGVQVTITGRRQEVLDEVAGDGLFGLAMDVRDEADVDAKIAAAVDARGPVQICIANAGVAEGRAFHKMSLEFWRNMMATNLDGAFLTIRACLPGMREAGWGRVITISSVAGIKGLKGAACYTASKHGLIGLTRALSEDYLGTDMTFNAICPGYVATPIVDRNVTSISERAGVSADEALKIMVEANRHKRLIDADEIAAAAMWLTGPGSQSVNGQVIEIAGGQM
ncbi:SDR family NAD(P)-dependent oxidoreductase [Chachezhania antarctica]|uniref:SDR family NAD(P)-dependent oxidoreductase n=1 Tax=Chachezhania antarctica TaxID=2340860 RepID=UPI000EB258F8|nr:SDR family NAD(P)-dependent oxidoreductase [Chachezhania antarctica]|tara:strand:+ start:2767 stop:3519 length:753 start_codon:yes stop_codon:yes gene_type:complete